MTASNKPVTNVEVVVLALGRLGGTTKKVFSEEIAVEAHGLAAGRFSWRLEQYRERGWPDKYIVKTALEDAQLIPSEGAARISGAELRSIAEEHYSIQEQIGKLKRVYPVEILEGLI